MDIITGGLGFIGNELARQLSTVGEVALIDNRNRIAPDIGDLENIKVFDVDISDFDKVRGVFQIVKPKRVFHLAAIHYIPECNDNPGRTLRINVEGTMGIARACGEVGVEHLLVASSGAVYADSPETLSEKSPVAPVDIYGLSKLFAENLCTWFSASSRLPITLCRMFNNIGPRETNRHIVPEIIAQLKLSDEIHLGNTAPRRDYIHTRDTARALMRLAGCVPEGVEIVNVASGQHASVNEIIMMMAGILNRDIRVVADPHRFRLADKLVQVADTSRLKEITGWEPEISLREGLVDLLRYERLLS